MKDNCQLFLLPYEKRSYLKATLGANSFLSELTPFQKGIDVQESKQEATKFVINGRKFQVYPFPI